MLLFSIQMVILVLILLLYIAMVTEGIKLFKRKRKEKKQKEKIIINACDFYQYFLSKKIDNLDFALMCAVAKQLGVSISIEEIKESGAFENKQKLEERLDYYINSINKFDIELLFKKMHEMNIALETENEITQNFDMVLFPKENSLSKQKVYVKK